MIKSLTYGRAGNFYFQVAASIGLALKHGMEFTVNNVSSHSFWNPVYLSHLANPNWNPNLPSVTIDEPCFNYTEIPFHESYRNMNVILNGYWQSPRYFSDYKNKIIELFAYPWALKPDTCSIQARFGDYLTIPGKHIVVDKIYLESAMHLVTEKTGITKFKVFSDDLQHFKNNFGSIYDFEYSTNNDIEKDLIEISCCHSNINSSSTFAFWGAYLNRNPDKVVVTQRQWFKPNWKDDHGIVDTSDIIPNDWYKL